ncbi:MAG: hypothetical protein NTV69_01970 [Caldilinea sp.]|nr:hypothetical protein [Caldilinea sp.]
MDDYPEVTQADLDRATLRVGLKPALPQDAIRILYRELGVVETVRFLRQFTGGYGDYAAEREALLGGKSLDELLREIKARRGAAADVS